ncbi:CPBP family intramembrane metalloprotease [Altererythrobacter aerius]|uniref:CPBP family intramembrane metalloprotease n=1 Tax=Tsuneonella aeria TaxID=1837929 RepID=A0A6I4TB70_9SPHN|nr:CPBP family intramembrane glutamic endopeptidase [Tsuneonella aeria]MXO73836.1 CPBP family intramembrane metalloprotease [Tsuneonella aeria]
MADGSAALTPGKVALALAAQALLLIGAGVALWVLSGRDVADFVDFGWRPVLQGLVFGGVLIAVLASVFRLFPDFLEHTARQQARMAQIFPARTGMRNYVWLALCAGIGEEAVFRGGLQTLLTDWMHPALAVVLAAAGFAAIHLARPLITAIILVAGIIFGAVYWATGSLVTVMVAHALYDVWALRTLHRELIRLGYCEPGPAA